MTIKIFLTITSETSYAEKILTKLKSFDEVHLVCLIDNGCYDIVAIIDVETYEAYRTFAVDKIGKLPNVEASTSFITLGI